jgi:RNA polymerase sigma-70 factor, ECF subfamily
MSSVLTRSALFLVQDTAEEDRSRRVADADLLRSAHAGDARATRELLDRHAPKLFRIVHAAHGDRQLAEDVVQETFLRAIDQAHQLREDTGMFSWLVRIAIRIGIDEKRKLRRVLFSSDPPEPVSDGPGLERSFAEKQDQETVRAALVRLSARHRELVVMRYFAGFSVAEIAEITERSEVAIRKDLERARDRLRKLLKTWFEEDA